jgi:hypothetical protein
LRNWRAWKHPDWLRFSPTKTRWRKVSFSAATSSSKKRRPAMVLNLRPNARTRVVRHLSTGLPAANFSGFRANTMSMLPWMERTPVRVAHTRLDISGSASGARTSTRFITSPVGESRFCRCGPSCPQLKTICTCLPPDRSSVKERQGSHPAAAIQPNRTTSTAAGLP